MDVLKELGNIMVQHNRNWECRAGKDKFDIYIEDDELVDNPYIDTTGHMIKVSFDFSFEMGLMEFECIIKNYEKYIDSEFPGFSDKEINAVASVLNFMNENKKEIVTWTTELFDKDQVRKCGDEE